MRVHAVLVVLIFQLISLALSAQQENPYRNKNWQPKQGKYFFSEAIQWEFLNEGLPKDDDKHAGTFTVYFDRFTGTMLFTQEAYGLSSEMADFIILQSNGRYFEGFTDEFGGKQYMIDTLECFSDITQEQQFIKKTFKELAKPSGKFKVFGKNKYGWETIKAELHELSFLQTSDKSQIYVANLPFLQLPLFLFNDLESEAKLPVNINFSLVIPQEYWVVEDIYSYPDQKSGKKITIRTTLKSISPTEYFVDLSSYKLLK